MSEPARAVDAGDVGQPVADLQRARARRGGRSEWRAWVRELREVYPDLSRKAVAVAQALTTYADAEGYCFPRHTTIARDTHYTTRTVGKAIRELASAGAIQWEPARGHRGARFWLLPHPPKDETISPQTRTDFASDEASNSLQLRTAVASEVSPISPPGSTTGSSTTSTNPPQPPKGGRDRDWERWRDELRDWGRREGFSDNEVEHAEAAMLGRTRAKTLAEVRAFVDRWTTPPAPAPSAPAASTPCQPADGGEQLELQL